MCDLEGPQQPFVEQLMWGQASDGLALHRYMTRRRCVDTRNHIKKSGFSSSVWANQSGDRALCNLQRRTIHCAKTHKGFH